MSFLDSRKPWCTQRLCQLSQAQLSEVLHGLERYGFPSSAEIENCAYVQATNANQYMELVAKAIYDILRLKKNIHNLDQEALKRAFDELRFGKQGSTDTNANTSNRSFEGNGELFFDRTKYDKKTPYNKVKVTKSTVKPKPQSAKNHVKFQIEQMETKEEQEEVGLPVNSAQKQRLEAVRSNVSEDSDEVSSTTSTCSADRQELEQLDRIIGYVKSNKFNSDALIEKLREKYPSDAKLSHKMKIKLHCLLELLDGFECFDEFAEMA